MKSAFKTFCLSVAIITSLIPIPSVMAQTVQTNRLDSLKSLYAVASSKIVVDAYKQNDLAREGYEKSLKEIMQNLKQKGDIDGWGVIDAEMKRFQVDKTVTTNVCPPDVSKAVAAYEEQVKDADTDAFQRQSALLKKYIAALNGLVRDLMNSNKIEEARAAGNVRKEAEDILANMESKIRKVNDEPTEKIRKVESQNPTPPGMKPVPADAVEFKGHHIKVFSDVTTWDDASYKCRTMSGHLVVIEDNEMNSFIYNLMRHHAGAWIGAEEGVTSWRWVTSKPFKYQRWANGQPGGSSKQRGKLIVPYLKAAMFGDRDVIEDSRGKWLVQPSKEPRGLTAYVCEWDY